MLSVDVPWTLGSPHLLWIVFQQKSMSIRVCLSSILMAKLIPFEYMDLSMGKKRDSRHVGPALLICAFVVSRQMLVHPSSLYFFTNSTSTASLGCLLTAVSTRSVPHG